MHDDCINITGKWYTEFDMKAELSRTCTEDSRFGWFATNVSLEGQLHTKQDVSTRLNRESVDIIAIIFSSNRCENYFVLVEYSEGKRTGLGMSDSWCVMYIFVTWFHSNNNCTDNILDKVELNFPP